MHFVHLIRFLFKFRGKGKFVLPIVILSFILIAVVFEGFNALAGLTHDRFASRIFTGGGFLLAAAINSLVSKNHITHQSGDPQPYEEEGHYKYIRVSIWTKIFIVLGLISFAGILYDKVKPLI